MTAFVDLPAGLALLCAALFGVGVGIPVGTFLTLREAERRHDRRRG